jgi:hypothetical protein
MAVKTTFQIIYKALPILVDADNSVTVTVRTGYVDAQNVFITLATKQVVLTPEQAQAILQAAPEKDKTRWDDLSDALYTHLIAQGHIVGEIL